MVCLFVAAPAMPTLPCLQASVNTANTLLALSTHRPRQEPSSRTPRSARKVADSLLCSLPPVQLPVVAFPPHTYPRALSSLSHPPLPLHTSTNTHPHLPPFVLCPRTARRLKQGFALILSRKVHPALSNMSPHLPLLCSAVRGPWSRSHVVGNACSAVHVHSTDGVACCSMFVREIPLYDPRSTRSPRMSICPGSV